MLFEQLSASLVLLQLHLLIFWNKNLTNMFVVSISKYSVLSLAENQVKKNYNKIHLSGHLKRCYAYILKFICVQRDISLFLIALRTRFHHRFLVLLLYLRFDQISNKLQHPFRNQRHKFTTLRSRIAGRVQISRGVRNFCKT